MKIEKKNRNPIRPQLTDEEKAIRLIEQKRACYQKSVERLKQYRTENNTVVKQTGREPKTQANTDDDSNPSDSTTATATAVVVKRGRKPKNNKEANNGDSRSASLTPSTTSTTTSDDSKVF